MAEEQQVKKVNTVKEFIFKGHDPYANVVVYNYNSFAFQDNAETFFKSVIKELQPKLIIEIGTWIGGSAIMMADYLVENNIAGEIVCVDTWLGSVEHWGEICEMKVENGRPIIYKEFLSNVVNKGYQNIITPFPIDSTNGLLYFQKNNIKADLIYVDGGHDYMSVKNDLYNASNVVRIGGWIIGDDYHHPDVRRAALEVFGAQHLHEKGNKFVWVK